MIPGDTPSSITILANMATNPTSLASARMARPAETGTMPTSSVGRIRADSGVTLVEMLVVVALISLMVGISFPSITSGIDSLRLNAATNGVVSFFNSALNRAERRQQVMEVTISKADNALWMRSTEPGFVRKLEMPDGVVITDILPKLSEETE